MKFIIDKRNYIIFFIIVFLSIFLLFFPKRKAFVKSYRESGLITVVIYDNINKSNVNNNIKKILKKDYKVSDYGIDVSNYDIDGALKVNKIISYFSKNNIKNYMINENGNVSVGSKYGKSYLVSLNLDDDVKDVIYLKNNSLESVKYEGKYDGVFVIDKDNVRGYVLANYLSDLKIDEAKKECVKYGIDAYFIKDDEVYMTDGFKKFIK